jgi:hypothetical protein
VSKPFSQNQVQCSADVREKAQLIGARNTLQPGILLFGGAFDEFGGQRNSVTIAQHINLDGVTW